MKPDQPDWRLRPCYEGYSISLSLNTFQSLHANLLPWRPLTIVNMFHDFSKGVIGLEARNQAIGSAHCIFIVSMTQTTKYCAIYVLNV